MDRAENEQNGPLKLLLVANYLPDRWDSMNRFADMLARGMSTRGLSVRTVRPEPIVNPSGKSAKGLGKWLGYIDKFVLFPPALAAAAGWADVVHICDSYNSGYVGLLKDKPVVVTCHDLLAVKEVLGESTDCQSSPLGHVLRRWQLKQLQRADAVACDSVYTRADVERLSASPRRFSLHHIQLPIDERFGLLSRGETMQILQGVPQLDRAKPFVLHVGTSHPRKNRAGVLRTFALASRDWDAQLVLAGEPLSAEHVRLAESLGITHKMLVLVKPSDLVLKALYNAAFVFLFPSTFEGYGWPLLEAQACGCPVVCSTCGPFPEVVGDSAQLRAVDDEEGMAEDILKLKDDASRREWILRGSQNIKRFSIDRMINEYISLYRALCGEENRKAND